MEGDNLIVNGKVATETDTDGVGKSDGDPLAGIGVIDTKPGKFPDSVATPPEAGWTTVPLAKSKKLKRMEKKAKKLITEFELAKSNDAIKRPGEVLDFPPELKRVRELAKAETAASKATNGGRKQLSPEEFKDLKARLRARKKILTEIPKLTLQGVGLNASLSMAQENRIPIMVSDVQQLLLYALGGNTLSYPPERWCYLQKYTNLTQIVVLVLEGLSCHDFFTYEHFLPKVTSIFQDRVEVMSPFQYGTDFAQEMACVALTQVQKQNILKKYGTIEAALHSKEVFKVFRALFPINFAHTEAEEEDDMNILGCAAPVLDLPLTDMFPRTYLLLSLQQMVMENYPLPFDFEMEHKYADYKMSKRKYKEVSNNSPIFAIDCEMCITTGTTSELTRIAVVNENHEVVYESFVKPKNRITNYLTEYSGITKKSLKDVTTTLEDVQKALETRLPRDAILVGHSLNCDLHAMKMIHPYVIDTSVIFNVSGQRNKKPKLAMLVESFLGEEIQASEGGHCPVEDAIATMKMVQLKLARGFRFGDALIADEAGIGLKECQLSSSIFNQTAKASKSVTVIAPDSILEKYKNFSLGSSPESFVPVPVKKSKQAIKHLQAATVNHNMSLAHLDLTSKVETKKMEDVMQKVDDMCQSVFNHVSKNGLFVTLFTGPNTPPKRPSSSDSSSDDDHTTTTEAEPVTASGSSNAAGDTGDSVDQSVPNSPKPTKYSRTLHNGVCLLRIHTQK